MLDIGSQIQASIRNPIGRARPAFIASALSGKPEPFVMNSLGFNQTISSLLTTYSGKGIGRFAGDIRGNIKVNSDGSYIVKGTMTFEFGKYSWTPDSDKNNRIERFAEDAAIYSAGSRFYAYPGGYKFYSTGNAFNQPSTRTYGFLAFGNRNRAHGGGQRRSGVFGLAR